MSGTRVIKGHDGPLVVDEDNRTVTKTYLCNPERARAQIEREITRAARFHDALAPYDGVACPSVLDYDLGPQPHVVFSLCRGQPLSDYLRSERIDDARAGEIADKIYDGVRAYTRQFGEPYYDLSFPNMLYDAPTRMLTFLDFGLPTGVDLAKWGPPLEASLGNLIGQACYDLVRPAYLLSPSAGYMAVMQAVLASFEGKVNAERVRELAVAVFTRLTRPGRKARQRYYRTVGASFTRLYLTRLKLGWPVASLSEA